MTHKISISEAEAARSAGVQAALVSREGNAPLSDAITSSYPVLYSFTELVATNKRKTDAQVPLRWYLCHKPN